MWQRLLGGIWRRLPRSVRVWGGRALQPRFTVTAGAVVLDERGRVLLLEHVFRQGRGWGIPGGFLKKGEAPEDAVRRELREETGLEVESAQIIWARTLKHPSQVETLFVCRARAAGEELKLQNLEIKSAAWFASDELPSSLSRSQRQMIQLALEHSAREAG